MITSKLWQLLQPFSSEQWREAERFVQSPFFNRKAQLIRLLDYCKNIDTTPTHEEAFSAAYPNQSFDRIKLRLAMSDLYKLLLQFLAYQEWASQTAQAELLQAKALRKMGLNKLARQNLHRGYEVLESSDLRNTDYFQLKYEYLAENYVMDYHISPADASALPSLSETANLALLSAKLRQACLSMAHQSVYVSDVQLGFIELVIDYIQKADLLKQPAIGLYFHCFFMLRNKEEEDHFQTFKELLMTHGAIFTPSETRDLYLMAINYCIRKVNDGYESYFHQIMELYEAALAGEYLLENGQLSRFTYSNIVAAGLQTERYEWVQEFIFAYRSKLPRPYRESSFSFCLARLEYAQRNYDNALPLLQKANYKDPLLNLPAKVLLMKIYYELDEYDLLHAHLDAMQNYILRKRVLGYHRSNYLNIIRYTRKLVSLNFLDKTEVQKRRDAILKESILTEKKWLLQQLE